MVEANDNEGGQVRKHRDHHRSGRLGFTPGGRLRPDPEVGGRASVSAVIGELIDQARSELITEAGKFYGD